MTSKSLSEVNTQYLIIIANRECLHKKVLLKSTKSEILLFLASVHQQVNSKLLLVFFLDCCHAEGMTKGGLFSSTNNSENKDKDKVTENPEGLAQKIDNDKGISIVSSCREDQLSYILEGDKNSLFTKCLLQVLKAEHKKHYDDEFVRISEVIQYIFRKVPEMQPEQRPYVNLQIYDDFILSNIPEDYKQYIDTSPRQDLSNADGNETTQKKERKEIVTAYRKTVDATNLLLFIHGFSGEAADTFGRIPELLMEDSKMDGWDMLPLGYSQYVKPELGKDIWAGIEDVNKIADYFSKELLIIISIIY